jgi:hypothetical protein
MSFKRYAQFGPVSPQQAQPAAPAADSYGAFMMQMLPMMMQQARIQHAPIGPTPEQMAGVGQSPLGESGPVPPMPGLPPQAPPVAAPQVSTPAPAVTTQPVAPDPNYTRGAYLALMRQGMKR